MIGQKAEQERHSYHGDQVHRALSAATASFAGQVASGSRAGHQAADEFTVANDDGEEREEEAENYSYVV